MRVSTICLSAACALLTASSVLLWRNLEGERARADALEQRVAALSRTIRSSPHEDSADGIAANDSAAALQASKAPGYPAENAAVTRASDEVDRQFREAMDSRERERELLRDPKYFNAKRTARRLELGQRLEEYQRLGLGLPADKAEKLLDFWVDQELKSWMEYPPPPRNHAERIAFAEYHDRRQREQDAALRAALGESAYEKYKDYMASRPSRNQVQSLRSQLGDGSHALREDQIEPLVAVMRTEREQLDGQLLEYVESEGYVSGTSPDAMQRRQKHVAELTAAAHQRMHDSAASILSARQLAALDAMLKRERDIALADGVAFLLDMQARQDDD